MRGDEVVVENIAFEGARGPNRNGSGIRHEEGTNGAQLRVSRQ
jgi:hypothetical protein